MKKILLCFIALSAFLRVEAQLPSLNFDGTWTGNSLYPAPDPDGWISTNVLTNALASSSNPTSVTQSTLNCSGGSSMRVETKVFTLGLLSGFLPDTCGFAFTGTVVVAFSGGQLIDGFPFPSRPDYLTYCYQAQPAAGDTCGIGVLLWKWTGTSRNYIGGGLDLYPNTVSSITNATMSIVYTQTITPDSMCIYVGSSYKFPSTGTTIRKGAKVGSVFYVDNIHFPGVGLKENQHLINLSVFPNPSANVLKVVSDNFDANEMIVKDITGKEVDRAYFIAGSLNLGVSSYPNGVYLYTIKSVRGEILKSGKFTVQH